MKKIMLFMAACVSVMFIASCSNDDDVADSDASVDTDELVSDSLVYVPQVNATDSTNGFVAHWEGVKSHVMFEDAEGKTPLVGGVIFANLYQLTPDSLCTAIKGDFTENMLKDFQDGTYFSYGDAVTSRGATGTGGIWSKLAIELAKGIGKAIGNTAAKKALSWLFGEEETNDNMDKIYAKLKNIDEDVNGLMAKINKVEAANVLKERLNVHDEMRIHTGVRLHKIMQLYQQCSSKTLDDATYDAICKEVMDWKNTNMGAGHDALEYNIQIMENTCGNVYTFGGKTLPEMYDYYADLTYPWEHEGYLFREAARLTDYMLVFEGYVMCRLYSMISENDTYDQRLEDAFNEYIKVQEAHPVAYNDDLRVFNFSDTKVAFKKTIKLLDFPWQISTNYANKPMWSTGTSNSNVTSGLDDLITAVSGTTVDHFATASDYRAIYSAYNKNGAKKTLGQIFKDAGFESETPTTTIAERNFDITSDKSFFCSQNTSGYEPGSEGSWPTYSGRYYRYKIFIWKSGHTSNKDFIHIRNSFDQNATETEHRSIYDNSNVNKRDGIVSRLGDWSHNEFFTLITSDFAK